MFALLSALALAGTPAPAFYHQAAAEKEKDPIVCKGDRSSRSLGSNMLQGRVCKRKSDWKAEEQHTQRELQQANDRWKDPAPAPAPR